MMILRAIASGNEAFNLSSCMYSPRLMANLGWVLRSPQENMADWTAAIATPVDNWLQHHPFLQWITEHPIRWMAHHPLMSLVCLAVTLLMLWSLGLALAEMTRDLWIFVLKIPLKFGRWLLRQMYQLLISSIGILGISHLMRSVATAEHVPEGKPTQSDNVLIQDVIESIELHTQPETVLTTVDVVNLLQRLEKLSQEQHQILHQLAILAKTNYSQRNQSVHSSNHFELN